MQCWVPTIVLTVPTHNYSQQSQEFDKTCTAVLTIITNSGQKRYAAKISLSS